MTDEQTDLLEKVLTAQVLVLSHLLERAANTGGSKTFNVDFRREASKRIAREQTEVIALLRSAAP